MTAARRLTRAQAQEVRSLVDDGGYGRAAAVAWVRALGVPDDGRRCVAPLDDDGDRLCGAPATEERVVEEDLVCPLCAAHAREYDGSPAEPAEEIII